MPIDQLVIELRWKMAGVERIDPAGKSYPRLCAFLDKQNSENLKIVAKARIKFISIMAINRLAQREIAA